MKNISDKLNEDHLKFNGIYRAIVVATEDPRDIGRVKVHVPGVFPDDMNVGDYPWAKPAVGVYNSGGDNDLLKEMSDDQPFDENINDLGTGGVFTVPNIGNTVFVWFDQGNFLYPYYFAMEAKEQDWLSQKKNLKEKINTKIEQIDLFSKKFKPEHGASGTKGSDWGDSAYINARQDVSSDGEAPGGRTLSSEPGSEDIGSVKYTPTKVNHSNEDTDGLESKNMTVVKDRVRSNQPTLDIKPLYDKENEEPERLLIGDDADIDYKKNPHVYPKSWKVDDVIENQRNINRYVTSIMTKGGTTIVIDNRDGQENYYLIHKGYMQNIDQHGSVKEYVGTNTVDGNTERCDKELGVEGDNKIHVLGNFVTYVKGNKLTQIDKNLQIDVNDSTGIRMKKGDFDIVLNGEESSDRDDNKDSQREGGKKSQKGDMNIDIQKGNMHVHVNKNINIHSEGNVNLKVDGDLSQEVTGNYSLKVGEAFVVETKEVVLNGALSTSKDIKSGANVSAGGDFANGTGVSLGGHQHSYRWNWGHGGGEGNSITKKPQGSKGATAPKGGSPIEPTKQV